ncbi:MAG: STAS domain-containing protein [Bacilli bacterium]|jgi:anti-sigma B factor antagonist|nr:STAS domain-containing protein [Bacilli bacterium]
MIVHSDKKGQELIISLSGSVNTQTAGQFEEALKAQIADVTKLTIDMKDVDYVSSAGLRVFLWAVNQMDEKGDLKVINLKPEVKEVFDLTGFSDILNIG